MSHDRYHLIGSNDFDLCQEHFDKMSEPNKQRFQCVLNEHMGGPVGFLNTSEDNANVAPPTEAEEYHEAMYGFDSEDERSTDSLSYGSLDDFIESDDIVYEEEQLFEIDNNDIESMDLDFFMNSMENNASYTQMENEYGQIEEWSETDEDEDEAEYVDNTLNETVQDRLEENYAKENIEIIRVWNRAFHKRQIKPRLGNLFTYPSNHINIQDNDEE